jgi:Protein of unknown function (DUF1549)/Protein of unknown function (DUF1553)/Planctomycete cytochrome C
MRTSFTSLLLFCCLLTYCQAVDFPHDIVPILKQQCGKCHAGSQKKGGLSLNSRESLLAGGESGAAIVVGKADSSEIYKRIISHDESLRMPPEGEQLTAAQAKLIADWINTGATWEVGLTLGPRLYEPPLKPRMPELPAAVAGREHAIDRILDNNLLQQKRELPIAISEDQFLRRASLDLIGLLPTPEERQKFLANESPQKRQQLVQALLSRNVDYAEHWLTFWNDLLRNDYTGTGFITGGRKQISKWLYEALLNNKPYDVFARELIAPPNSESAGFADGIRWRGEVSAGQTVEIQFAQSVGQTFLGINLKCASCHDSFIDRWTLEEAYGLAAIYSQRPLELHRCDKPIGKMAHASWMFSELGQVNAQAPQPERLKQLASLMTHKENGRFTRTIVNRLWHRLMGRGIVHPTDAMQTEPWNADLLDYLAEHLVQNNYDLKKTLEHIATSQAYQSRCENVNNETDNHGYKYAGPRAKRLSAEQFMDSIWQITQASPNKIDAPVIRGQADVTLTKQTPLQGVWIWSQADTSDSAAGETLAFRTEWNLESIPTHAAAVISCDNSYTLYINNKQVKVGNNWEAPDLVALQSFLKKGTNEVLIIAKNEGAGKNPAALFFETRWTVSGKTETLSSSSQWQWSKQLPNKNGKFNQQPQDWQAAAKLTHQTIWMSRVQTELAALLDRGESSSRYMVRASLVKSDFLMRSLGRPNRDQIVTVRPLELSALEALDLANGEILANYLRTGAAKIQAKEWKSTEELVTWLYAFALSREPTPHELSTLQSVLGEKPTTTAMEDVLWTLCMLPEFQFVR